MPTVIESMELLQVLSEAEDIAQSVNQPLTSAHQLLAFFTVPNRAEILLREKRVDEDRILAVMAGKPRESEAVSRAIRDGARTLATGAGASEIDCLHLLAAMTRERGSCAHQLLAACGVDPRRLRTETISLFANGLPRKYQQVRAVPVPARAAPRRQAEALRPAPAMEDAELAGDLESAAAALARDLGVEPAAEPPPTFTPAPAPAATSAHATRSRHALDPREFPWLSQLGRNLTELAAAGKLDPLVGREREVEEAIDVLGKRRTNNPLLIGEPGVGKTAIAEGIAQRLLHGSGEGSERTLVEIDMASVLAGTQLRGSFSEKLLGLKDEVRRAGGKVIVFIDEIHTIMGAGSTGEGPQDAANELKAALARGEFPCIGATTHDEYRQHIQKDPALERRFSPVLVREPSVADTVTILSGLAPRYEKHHAVRFSTEALQAAAALSARYITDRFLPDKAVAVVDLAGSRARRQHHRTVDATDIARVVAKMAGLPESRLIASDRERILGLEQALGERVIGHEEAIGRVARVLKRNFAGFASRRPMGSFLFLGPTGVGKTELAKSLADALYGSREALVQLDMSECSEPTGVARLVGAARGPPPAGLRGGARRDREGPPRRADAPPAGARGGAAHRRTRPPDRLLQRRGGAHHQPRRRRVDPHQPADRGLRRRREGRASRVPRAGGGPGRDATGALEPPRRAAGLPLAHPRPGGPRGGAAAGRVGGPAPRRAAHPLPGRARGGWLPARSRRL
jgi:ATP-dependent Clp protease ATP-binding subunit ClpC